MRSWPVNLAAARATPELLIMDSRERLELLHHFGFLYFFEERIATQATGKWSDRGEEIKAPHYFDGLFSRVLGARIIAMLYDLVHEQPAIAREQGAIIDLHDGEQLSILRVPIVNDIETEQAQVAREFSEMAISDKSIDFFGLQSILRKKRRRRLDGISVNFSFALQNVREIDRLPVHQDQINLGMRHSARLNHVFNRGLLAEAAFDYFITRFRF